MTVGAAVTAQTKIIRGNRRVSLNTIKEGDIVWLTYVKAPGGVKARSVRLEPLRGFHGYMDTMSGLIGAKR
jgi:hypothetical protein